MFQKLIAELEPKLQKAFLQAIADLKRGVNWSQLIEALKNGDLDAAVAVLSIEPAVFSSYYEAKVSAYTQGGTLAATTVNGPAGGKVTFRFDVTNPQAEAWIRKNVANKIAEDSEVIKQIARRVIQSGYSSGRHPNSIARDLVGRVENGRRKGGILGLTDNLASYRDSMRSRLSSGDQGELMKVLRMTRRDKRFDSRINAAINGRRLTSSEIDQMVSRYEDKLLALRAETVARTETGMAVMAGRKEEWDQALSKLGYPADAVEKTWMAGGGGKDPRPEHQAMGGHTVVGLNTPFVFGNVMMQHALDPAGGAEHCANCTCDTTFRIDHSWGVS